MRAKIENVVTFFESQLDKELLYRHLNIIMMHDKISLCENCLYKLYTIVLASKFQTRRDEIIFFKKQKPYIHGYFKYFLRLQKYILRRGLGSSKRQIKFINDSINLIQQWYEKESEFIVYCKLNKNSLDEKYFLKNYSNTFSNPQRRFFLNDPLFSTKYSDLKAEYLANELLLNFFSEELEKLTQTNNNNNIDKTLNRLSWSKSKTDLVELLYALKSSLAIQDGNIEMRTLASQFEKLFHTKLGNYYKTYGEIKSRKKEKTPFLNLLKFSLERQIAEDNNYN